jgi:putative FmdB family regulatory protein
VVVAYPEGKSSRLAGGGRRLVIGHLAVELPIISGWTILKLMPIYEYECSACGRIDSHVIIGSQRAVRPSCSYCGAKRLNRVMSSFAVVESESARLSNFDTGRSRDESFYRDSRNVGLWAKKRAKEMGVDLGSKFDETVEKARTGKLIKEST